MSGIDNAYETFIANNSTLACQLEALAERADLSNLFISPSFSDKDASAFNPSLSERIEISKDLYAHFSAGAKTDVTLLQQALENYAKANGASLNMEAFENIKTEAFSVIGNKGSFEDALNSTSLRKSSPQGCMVLS